MAENPEFLELKELLASDKWPVAVNPTLICDVNSEADKINRAEGIVEILINEKLDGKKFLDFGCGEGHVAKVAGQKTSLSVGYDIQEFPQWEGLKSDTILLTTNMDVVKAHAPYDAILVYDVLDHMTQPDAATVLSQIKDLLADNGTIYLRTHPFSSRHATHLYRTVNKAYIHIVFSDEELKELGYDTPVNAGVLFPIKTYGNMITSANLKTVESNIVREKIEPFFPNTPTIKKRFKDKFNHPALDFPGFQCEQQFLDFTLRKK